MTDEQPTLKQLVGAMIVAANRSLSLREIRRVLDTVAADGGPAEMFGGLKEKELAAVVEELIVDLERLGAGMRVVEVAGGFRLQTDPRCGRWLRVLLEKGKPSRLSQPSLETLAVIAYRQPLSKAQIEEIRGVSVDHVLKTLLELQLVRIVGRSELPGRPFLYGTTGTFLEHFGLRDLGELEEVNPMLKRRDRAGSGAGDQPAAADPGLPAGVMEGEETPADAGDDAAAAEPAAAGEEEHA